MPFANEASDAPAGEPVELGGAQIRPGAAIGPYRYERLIGRGGMALVLLVRDADDRALALKVLQGGGKADTALRRFRREFRALARLRHPNVIQVEGYGQVLDQPYIAMEYADGPDLYQSLRRYKELPAPERWRRVEAVLIDICQALHYIHRRGLVHRDLKPSNVLQTSDGRCKLTDFGIVKDLEEMQEPGKKTRVGTWAYCSPEQIAGQPVDARADLYSLGIILYTMLAGRRPFNADDMAGYLTAHREQTPTPPSRYEPTLPRRLQDICLKLLAKAPRDRFQSAAEILYQLEQLDPVASARQAPGDVAWELPLVGREAELGLVHEAMEALSRGQGGVLLLQGAEGVGKTRLLGAAVDQARLRGVPVMFSRAAPQDGSYRLLLQLASDIGRELGERASPELGSAIQRFFGAGVSQGDARYQLFDAVRDALEQLLLDGPRVLAIDDLHHAPPPLLAMLSYLIRAVLARDDLPLLFLASARPSAEVRGGEAAPASLVAAFLDGANLGINPVAMTLGLLSDAEIAAVVQALLGPGEGARALAARLHAETAGNPLFLAEFLRSLRQRGLLEARGDRLVLATDVGEIARGHLEVPPGVRQVVLRRMESLSSEARDILEILAVSDRELDLDVILEALARDRGGREQPEELWLDRIDGLVEAGLLVERQGGGQIRYDFVHRKTGDVLYRDLDPARRAALHRRLGALLDARAPDSPLLAEAIGEHYRRGGESGPAYLALVRAAVHLWDRTLLAEAWDVAQRAAAVEEQAEAELPEERYRAAHRGLLKVRAEALFNRGLWDDARVARERLIVEAEAVGDLRLRDVGRLGLAVLLRRLGRPAEGEALIREVLAEARERLDRQTVLDALRNLSAIAWDRGDLDEIEYHAAEGLVIATGPELASGRAHMLLALSTVQAARGQLAAAMAGLAEAEEILRRLRVKRTLCLALCNTAEILVWQGRLGEAIARANEALSVADEILFRVGEANAVRVRAMALLDAGEIERAAPDVERAWRICEELDLVEDRVATRVLLARLWLARGNPRKSAEHLHAGQAAGKVSDPENHLPLVAALLGRTLCLGEDAIEGAATLGTVAGQASGLRPVRRAQVLVALALGYDSAGLVERAKATAREALSLCQARGLDALALGASLVLLSLLDEEAALPVRAEATRLASAIAEGLPPDLVGGFRARLEAVGIG